MNDEEFDEPSEEYIERTLNESGPPTIKPPTPSDRTDKIVEWLTDPAVMLVDLTDTLNEILSICRWRYLEQFVRELIPEELNKRNFFDVRIDMKFQDNAEQTKIRNSIELTPFSHDVIDNVGRYFRTYTMAFHLNEKVSLETAHHFTDAISHYEFQLQILADWIESRAIFQGKKTPDPNRRKENSATEHDINQAIKQIVDSGRTVTKNNLADTIRDGLGKSIGNDRVQRAVTVFNRYKKNGPQ